MILAEKIMALRKQNGWSQEELAEKVGVSRQSVSKWESMQSVPDLDKILVLAQVFGVSTDYLLKEEMGEAEKVVYPDKPEEGSPRRVSMEEANEFLAVKKETSNKIAFATMLCILSPICLILFSGLSVTGIWTITENMAAGLGIAILLTMVVAAVAIFITCGMKTGRFEYLRTESIDTEYGVIGMVKEKQKALYPVFTRNVVFGVSLCILAVIPLVTASCITESEMVILAMVALLLSMVAVAVFLFISVGVKWESYKKLLRKKNTHR